MTQVQNMMFSLVRAALSGAQADAEAIKGMLMAENGAELYRLAKEHDLAHLVGCELDKMGLLGDGEISKKFRKQHYAAVFRYKGMEHAIEEMKGALCRAGIPHMPLKGSVLRYRYPEAWMRTSCDIDLLVNRENLERAGAVLVSELGYTPDHKTEHDVTYISAGGITVELHFALIVNSENEKIMSILGDPWSTAVADENGYTYSMSDDIFYFYHVVHMLKHFLYGGCGIRSFVDLWVLDGMREADADKRDRLLREANILTFAEKSRTLARFITEGGECDPSTEAFAGYVIAGGVYGGLEGKVYIQQAQRGGKLAYAIRRIFMPYSTLSMAFPILKKHKILVPLFQVVRWFKIIFGGRARSSFEELKHNGNMDAEKSTEAKKLLSELGIDKNISITE